MIESVLYDYLMMCESHSDVFMICHHIRTSGNTKAHKK